MAHAQIAPKAAPQTQASSKASAVTIDINDKCPRHCIFCYNAINRPLNRTMSLSQFSRILDSLPQAKRVEIGGGEPLLHRDLVKMMNLCFSEGREVNISTGAHIWKQSMITAARAHPELFSMQVNLPAGSAEAFKQMTGRDDFEKVLSNISRFAKEFPKKLCIVFTACRENMPQLSSVAEIARSLKLPLDIGIYIPVKGSNATPLLPEEIFSISVFSAAQRAAGIGVYSPHVVKNGKIVCPVISQHYESDFQSGFCPAQSGDTIYFDAGGNAKACEFQSKVMFRQE